VREGGKFIGVYPGTGYGIDYTIDFPSHRIGAVSGDLESGELRAADRAGADLSASRRTSRNCAIWGYPRASEDASLF